MDVEDDTFKSNANNINDFNVTSEKVKDAIIACAREEVRNFLYEIIAPLSSFPPSEEHRFKRPQKKCKKRADNFAVRGGLASKTRPSNALNCESNALSNRTNNAYNLDRHKEAKSTHNEGRKIGLDKVSDVHNEYGVLSCTEAKNMSFASSLLIKRSAKLLRDFSQTDEDDRIEPFKEHSQHFDESSAQQQISVMDCEVEEEHQEDNEVVLDERPRTVSGRIHRPFHRPTTALERRISLSRPTTAHLVRAKAEEFSSSLLSPLPVFQIKDSNTNDVFSKGLGGNEWENELARHIVSVFNSKIVSDTRNEKEVRHFNSKGGDCFMNNSTQQYMKGSNNGITSTKSSSFRQINGKRNISTTYGSKDSKKMIEELKPRLIWPIGTGESSKNNWDILNECTHFRNGATKTLAELAGKGKYLKYIDTVKESLCSSCEIDGREKLWRQLVLTVNSFGLKLTRQRRYSQAIEMLQVAQELLPFCDGRENTHVLDELKGYIKISLAFYYSKRNKPSAALKYIIEATSIQKRRTSQLDTMRCDLYRAYILQQLNRYNEAMKLLKSILRTVNDGTLDVGYGHGKFDDCNAVKGNDNSMNLGTSDPQVVLLIAVTYHNLSCLQLLKGQVGDACMNSQNCRKLSRLCMSVSNRYVAYFEETHLKAMNALFAIVCPRQTEKDAIVLERLFRQLFTVR